MSLGKTVTVAVPISQADGDVRYALSGTGGAAGPPGPTSSGTIDTYPVYDSVSGLLTDSRFTTNVGELHSITLSGSQELIDNWPSVRATTVSPPAFTFVGTDGFGFYGDFQRSTIIAEVSGVGAQMLAEFDVPTHYADTSLTLQLVGDQQLEMTAGNYPMLGIRQNSAFHVLPQFGAPETATFHAALIKLNELAGRISLGAGASIDESFQLYLATTDISGALGHHYSLGTDGDIKTSGVFYEGNSSLAEKYAPLVSGVNGTYTGTGVTSITIVSGIITAITMGA